MSIKPPHAPTAGATTSDPVTTAFCRLREAIQQLQLSPDGEDLALPTTATVNRAERFLQVIHTRQAMRAVTMRMPTLSPGPACGVDIYWVTEDRELLVHVAPNGDAIEFYGDDRGGENRIRGTVSGTEAFAAIFDVFVE